MPGSMKRVVVDHFGGPEVLRVVEDGVPRPGPGEVRVRWLEWYAATGTVALWGLLSPSRRVSAYRIQKLREGHQIVPMGSRRPLAVGGGPRDPEWFREDFRVLLKLLREGKIHPVVAERLPLSEARRAHELLETSAAKGKLVLVP
jgi:NADPH2:quinone reductase